MSIPRIIYFLGILLLLFACEQAPKGNDKLRPLPSENSFSDNVKLNSLTDAIKADPKSADNFYQRAVLHLELQNAQLALEDINKAIEIDSNEARYYFIKSRAARKVPNINQAIMQALKAESKGLKTPEVYVALGEYFYILQDYGRALDFINTGLKITPRYAEGYFYKGLVYAEKGDSALALSNLQTAIEQDPEYIDAYNKLASIALTNGDLPLAKEYISSGMRFNPKDATLNYNLGVYYFQEDKIDSAKYYFEKAVFFDKTMMLAHYNLAIIGFNAEKYREAERHIAACLTLNEKYIPGRFFAGLIAEKLEKWQEAERHFTAVAVAEGQFASEARDGYKRVMRKLQPAEPKIENS